ncbi:Polynucleotide 5'-hydroxyl-kinase grc3 [Actinomortierella ambigua]|nr:Polynucleotide 5'-hydroxyl-kinase grc3 [Actinomortierella ambigua]
MSMAMSSASSSPSNSYIPVFLDSGGVVNDNHVRGPQWVQCFREYMPTLGLAEGVAGAEWVEALALVGEEERRIDIWDKLLGDSKGYLQFERKYFVYWVNALERMLKETILPSSSTPARTVQLPPTEEEQLALAKSIHSYCVAHIKADIPGACDAILEMRTKLGCKLYTSSSELSTDLYSTFKTLDLLTLRPALPSEADGEGGQTGGGEPVFTKFYGPDIIDELKNSTAFYEKIFDDCGEDPRRSIVVDDKEEMLAAAKVLGCTTVLIRTKPLKQPVKVFVRRCNPSRDDATTDASADEGPQSPVPAVDIQLGALAELPDWIRYRVQAATLFTKSATVTVAVTKVTATTTAPVATSTPATPVAPMSAIAARRHAMMLAAQAAAAAATSAASTPEPQETNDDDDEGEKASLESGDEVGAGDDDEEDGANSSDSSGENDNSDDDDNNTGRPRSRSSSRNVSSSRQERRDRKLYLDPQSISTWQPSRFNIAYPSSNRPEVVVVGMKAGESIVFQGAAYVTPILGDAVMLGHVLSGKGSKGNHRKRSGGGDQPLQVNLSSLQSYPVFSPRTHALTTIDSIRLSQAEKKKLLYLGKNETASSPMAAATTAIPSNSLQTLVEPLLSQLNLQDFDTVLAIQSAVHTGIFGIEKVVPLFKGILSRGKQRPLNLLNTRDMTEDQQAQQKFAHALDGFHPILEPTAGIAALRIPDTWQNAIQALIDSTWTEHGDATIQRPPVAVVCGGKKLGKSTFSRVLLNRMLNRYRRVAFLECDIGQSEFSPVGMVALHVLERPALGPPFTHFRAPGRAFYVGHSTPRDDPDYYMACIQELVRTYFDEVSHTRHWDEDDDYHSDTESGDDDHIPLIVNTQGWIKGMGLDLLLQLLNCVRASHLFGFHSASNPESNLPAPFFDFLKAQANQIHPPIFHYVSAVVLGNDNNNLSPFSKFHPADHRTLALVSYFYAKQQHQQQQTSLPSTVINYTQEEEDQNQWDFTQALIVRRPWCWDWRQAKGVWVLFDQVPPSQILHALNASVVALLGDKGRLDDDEEEEEKGNKNQDNLTKQDSKGDQGKQVPEPEAEAEAEAEEAVTGDQAPPAAAAITPPNYFPLGQYPPPPPALTTCHGLAIIRSIQPATHSLHILTPIAPSTLARCNGIVKGTTQLPVHLSLDHNDEGSLGRGVAGVPWRKIPYLLYEKSGSGSGATSQGVLNSQPGSGGGGSGNNNNNSTGGVPMQRSQSFPDDYSSSQPSSPRIMGAEPKTTRKNLARKRYM